MRKYRALFLPMIVFPMMTACQPRERPDELELMTKDVLKNKRGVVIDIEPGNAEK